jgi:hypothetical protein
MAVIAEWMHKTTSKVGKKKKKGDIDGLKA